ncbi:MAG: hypothetical protein M3131_10335 [Actinomycetota bacterium]|nr:hypothetical protein [Actinomycetota bacterium]
MKRRLQLFVVLGTVAALVTPLALPAFAGDDGPAAQKRFAIGFRLNFTGPSSSAGPFSAAGAVSDSGNSNATFKITPTKRDEGRLEGTQEFVGSTGSITAHFRGTAGPLSSPRATGRGRFRIVSGTGAYAGIEGQGRFLVIADFTTGSVTGTYDGKLRHR